MLWNSRLLNGINWAFFLSVVGLNIFGLMVTNHLGSVFRAVLLTSRTASVRILLPRSSFAVMLRKLASFFLA